MAGSPTKSAPEAAAITARADAPSQPAAGQENVKPKRTVTKNGQEFPVEFSRINPKSGVIYDYFYRNEPKAIVVTDPITGIRGSKSERILWKKGRKVTSESDGLVAYEG
jgi:hypothetical protein